MDYFSKNDSKPSVQWLGTCSNLLNSIGTQTQSDHSLLFYRGGWFTSCRCGDVGMFFNGGKVLNLSSTSWATNPLYTNQTTIYQIRVTWAIEIAPQNQHHHSNINDVLAIPYTCGLYLFPRYCGHYLTTMIIWSSVQCQKKHKTFTAMKYETLSLI